ncbi:MAPEG family protein [Gallaecimonas kandeliae]|uniref:MAPEG family protein n=1 Tax=Gallaecimonas kandeliae TaxID=3029055 RepID=UPI0026477709|nr:MAPEG family protein [Gallaecimonas kandeliae]WKE65103.1 MAPEG family protein [Gallaecimonas kandeliae]
MSVEMFSLGMSSLLLLVLLLVAVLLHAQQVGLKALMGNREGLAEPSGMAGRARRAHLNLLENLVPFAVAVLMAHSLGITSPMTVAGAWLFLLGRLAHAFCYVAGIPVLRTLSFFVAFVGIFLVLLPVLLH